MCTCEVLDCRGYSCKVEIGGWETFLCVCVCACVYAYVHACVCACAQGAEVSVGGGVSKRVVVPQFLSA